MATAIELLKAIGDLASPVGQWRLRVSQILDQLSGGGVGGCCMNGVILGNVGAQFTEVPLACPQPDTNYIVTGVFAGGNLGTNEFAITAKTRTSFTVFITGGIPVGGLLIDFKIEHC